MKAAAGDIIANWERYLAWAVSIGDGRFANVKRIVRRIEYPDRIHRLVQCDIMDMWNDLDHLGAGVGQFIDLGAGLPTAPNVHEVARQVIPDARVAYVDNDPVVLSHLNARVAKGTPGVTVVAGDVRLHQRVKLIHAATGRRADAQVVWRGHEAWDAGFMLERPDPTFWD